MWRTGLFSAATVGRLLPACGGEETAIADSALDRLVDRGTEELDGGPAVSGSQRIPLLGLLGNVRVGDGNGDGWLATDLGAFEGELERLS